MEGLYLLLARYIFIFRLVGFLIGELLGCPSMAEVDMGAFDRGDYDCVFISMYTTEGFLESEYEAVRGFHIYKNQFLVQDEKSFRSYLDHILTSEKELKCMYLGLLPELVGADVVEYYAQTYPQMMFEVLPAYYDISFWQELDEKSREKCLQAYYEMCETSLRYENVRAYNYFGTEWLIVNPENYQNGLLLDPGVASTVMLTADYLQQYLITQENLESTFRGLEELIAEWNPDFYPDLSDWRFVFLGDSIFGNYRDGTSLPKVIEGLTGANTYNLGIGGTVAVPVDSCKYHLGYMIDLLEKEEFCQIDEDVSAAQRKSVECTNQDLERFFEKKEESPLAFFIHYGFNEYISNLPVQDSEGQIGFASALKEQIGRLRTLYPKAQIIVLVPNRITSFEGGTKITGENPYTLTDYVDAILSLSNLDGVAVINNYDVFLNGQGEVMIDCLADELHPSDKGRYLLGQNIAIELKRMLQNE